MKFIFSSLKRTLSISGFFLLISSINATSIFQNDPTYYVLAPDTAILEAISQGSDPSTIPGKSISNIFADNFSNEDGSFIIPTQVAHVNWDRSSSEIINFFAFTALLNDGFPFSWGSNDESFNSTITTPVVPNERKITSIFSWVNNFVAILDDGSLLLWGDRMAFSGTRSFSPDGKKVVNLATGINKCYSTFLDNNFSTRDILIFPSNTIVNQVPSNYFCAFLHKDGSITDNFNDVPQFITPPGGNVIPLNFPKDKKGISIFSNSYAFSAILDDGSILSWGHSLSGGTTPTLSKNKKAISIASTGEAFAAILDDRSLLCWGNASSGGTTPKLPENRKVVSITPNYCSFASILDDGSVLAWGNGPSAITPIIPTGKKVIFLTASSHAFAAILDDGSILSWGDDTIIAPTLLPNQKAIRIVATSFAFTALLNDGSIICWGDPNYGGKTPMLPSDTTVSSVVSNRCAFVAKLNDGSIISWGYEKAGGITPTLPFGKTVSSLVTPFEKEFTFQNTAELPSLAIIWNPSPEQGQWQYQENGSNTWIDIPSMPYPSDQDAFVLRSDAKIRFVPAQGFSGTPSGLTARLINSNITVSNGEKINVTPNGVLTPFSQGTISINTLIQ